MPGIRQREGGRSEARQGAGNKTAEGNKHAEEQATGPVKPRRDPEGDGKQEKTAIDLKAEDILSNSEPETMFVVAKAPSDRKASWTSTR